MGGKGATPHCISVKQVSVCGVQDPFPSEGLRGKES